MSDIDPDLATVVGLEQRLLEPGVRLDRRELVALLHEDFSEFGASGRVYDREGAVEALLASDGSSAPASDFRARRLGPDAILVTYRTGSSLRTSVWVRGDDGAWRVLHHHGSVGSSQPK